MMSKENNQQQAVSASTRIEVKVKHEEITNSLPPGNKQRKRQQCKNYQRSKN